MKKTLTTALLVTLTTGLLIFSSCSKDKEPETPTTSTPQTTEPTVNSDFQFTGTLDGVSFSHIDQKNGFAYMPGGTGAPQPEPDTSRAIYGGMIMNSTGEGFILNKGVRKFIYSDEKDHAQYFAFFAKGSYKFAAASLNSFAENGMELVYLDNKGKSWVSFGGSQSGSTVSIEDVLDITDDQIFGLVVKVKLKGNLYPEDGVGTAKKVELTAILPYAL